METLVRFHCKHFAAWGCIEKWAQSLGEHKHTLLKAEVRTKHTSLSVLTRFVRTIGAV
jgi:hypothetical protein